MVTADQLVAHAVGDYIIQSDWMANNKTRSHIAALVHAVSYCLPFVPLGPSWLALAAMAGSHFLIDRYRLARYLCWLKNWPSTPPWGECVATGYPPDRPPWMSVWLMIIADNTAHVICNGLAIRFL